MSKNSKTGFGINVFGTRRFNFLVFGVILLMFASILLSANSTGNETANTPYNVGLTNTISRLFATLKLIAPYIAMILIVLAGIVYAFSISQPAESRGKLQSLAIGLLVGGIIVAAFAFGAERIEQGSEGLLTG